MGTILKAVCSECGFEKNIFTGGGKMDCNIETILSALPEVEQNKLSEVVKLGARRITINREPCFCTSCKEIYSLPVVSYTLDDSEQTIIGQCPCCGSKTHESPQICPECCAKLSLTETGLWD